MNRWEWSGILFFLCNLCLSLNLSFAQSSSLSYWLEFSQQPQISLDSAHLTEVAKTSYQLLAPLPYGEAGKSYHLYAQLIQLSTQLESYPGLPERMLALRLRIAIDQSLLTYMQNHRVDELSLTIKHPIDSSLTLSLKHLLDMNKMGIQGGSNKLAIQQLEKSIGLAHAWMLGQFIFPSPLTQLNMIKLLLASRIYQLKVGDVIRLFYRESQQKPAHEQRQASFMKCLFISPKMLPAMAYSLQEFSPTFCYRMNLFHLFLPFLADQQLIKTELVALYGQDGRVGSLYLKDQQESIANIRASWLIDLDISSIKHSQVEQLLFASPFSQANEVEELSILVNQGERLFPVYKQLLSKSHNRTLLARIIHILLQVDADKAELIDLIRTKLFELYFLHKGEFLSEEQLIQEFNQMKLGEGGDLLLLLVGDQDRQVRLSALKRLAEIGDKQTYRKLKELLLQPQLYSWKRTRRMTEHSITTIYSRIIPPDPLEIFPKPTLFAQTQLKHFHTVAEQMPEFPGGSQALSIYLNKHNKYIPKHPMKGIVILRFIVEKNGKLSDIQIQKSLHPLYDKKAIKIIKSMPKWKAGMINQTPVAVEYYLPMVFRENLK